MTTKIRLLPAHAAVLRVLERNGPSLLRDLDCKDSTITSLWMRGYVGIQGSLGIASQYKHVYQITPEGSEALAACLTPGEA